MGRTEPNVADIAHWIGGRFDNGDPSARIGDVFDPARGEVVARVRLAGEREVASAVAAARRAFESWSQFPAGRRARVLLRVRGLVWQRPEALGPVITRGQGKVLSDG